LRPSAVVLAKVSAVASALVVASVIASVLEIAVFLRPSAAVVLAEFLLLLHLLWL
jgi:hypothetical protein